jgi:hypothetical protein
MRLVAQFNPKTDWSCDRRGISLSAERAEVLAYFVRRDSVSCGETRRFEGWDLADMGRGSVAPMRRDGDGWLGGKTRGLRSFVADCLG